MTNPVILYGTQSNGETLPVQVDETGRLVAEGLPGPEGPQGEQGPQGEPGPAGEPGSGGSEPPTTTHVLAELGRDVSFIYVQIPAVDLSKSWIETGGNFVSNNNGFPITALTYVTSVEFYNSTNLKIQRNEAKCTVRIPLTVVSYA